MKAVTKILKVYNPFISKYVDLVCNINLHFDKKDKLLGVEIESIISEDGDNIIGWLNADKVEEMTAKFLSNYRGGKL